MYLEAVRSPADLRSLDTDQLDVLCDEIRSFTIATLNSSAVGGHLGSNLGAVELTIALHRVLESPRDILLWDTGHQTYVHKMLTGRCTEFERLRQADGLSGYPSRAESEHDWIENSHASTVLGYAHGLAAAHRTLGVNDRRIVAVIGDGSMTGGMAFEGLNNLGHSGSDVTIVLNDNGRSYAPTVSLLSESLVKIRSNPIYMARQRRFEAWAQRLPFIGDLSLLGVKASKAAIRTALEPQEFFEPLGVRYMGPFDGHDIAEVEEALRNAAEFEGPVVVHVLTDKGRGFALAENDPVKKMHDTGGNFLTPASGASSTGSTTEKYTNGFSEALVKLGESHSEVVAITAAMPDSTGLLPFRDRFPDRFFDVGIAEQHAVTAAAGMAMGGLRPVVALYATFLSRAFDQANLDVGLHGQPVIFCLDRAGITGPDGASHHGVLDMVLLSKIPNMTMFAPSSYQELQQMLEDAYAITDGPVSIRWPRTPAPVVADEHVGRGLQARKVREAGNGDRRVCLIGIGKMLAAASEAAVLLEREGIDATVWDPRCIRPLDPAMLADAADHDIVVTIEDGLSHGGIGASAARALREQHGRSNVEVLGVPTEYIPHGDPDDILHSLGLDAEGVVAAVRRLL
jgi:1-deoxy-D-xylulose-5-phosphate synthase